MFLLNTRTYIYICALQSLVCKEGHLIVLSNEQEAAEGEEPRRRDERILAVAPNYVIEWCYEVLCLICSSK